MVQKVVIMLGSQSDNELAEKITAVLKGFQVPYQVRIASAHRTPDKVRQIVDELEKAKEQIVIIAVVGLSNALSGMLAGISALPVITCPAYTPEDINSSLRMPSGVAHATVLKPENAALYALKILALNNRDIKAKIKTYLKKKQEQIEQNDGEIQRKNT